MKLGYVAYSGFLSLPKVNTPTFVRLILHLTVTLGSGTRMTNASLLLPTPTSGMGTRREMDTWPPTLLTEPPKLLDANGLTTGSNTVVRPRSCGRSFNQNNNA